MSDYVKILGSRGSIPVCDKAFLEYGGNTSCAALFAEGKVLVFDAGSGIRKLADEKNEKREYHITLSHMHIDHILGLPMFAPVFDKNASVTIYGMKKDGRGIRERLHEFLDTSLWPVGDEYFRCDLKYVDMEPGKAVEIPSDNGGISLSCIPVSHPGGSAAFKASFGGKSFGYALDYEHGGEGEKELGKLFSGADVVIYDGHYFPGEYEKKRGFGHSTWEAGRAFQTEYNIKHLLVSHFEPEHTDEMLKAEESRMKQQYPEGIDFSKEGMEVYF
ncbi:MAG: MBL fold metallo-hydrolase [Lachnospiraceae bacterium]|nr:MBL fold metallo-hydrolase [Lachnospiraceae bacterium]